MIAVIAFYGCVSSSNEDISAISADENTADVSAEPNDGSDSADLDSGSDDVPEGMVDTNPWWQL